MKEIAAKVNRVQQDRDESLRVSPEKVGHKLKKIGLFTNFTLCVNPQMWVYA